MTALVNVGPENPREFREVVSTTEKLRPLAEATGGTVRRLSKGGADDVALPRIVELRDATLWRRGLHRDQAHRRVDADRRRNRAAGLGLWAMLALVGAIVAAWAWEGRR